MNKEQIVIIAFAAVVGIGATALVISAEAKREKNVLLVDVGGADVRIELDGVVLRTVAKGTLAVFDVKRGNHHVRALREGASPEEADFTVPSGHYFRGLLRVAGARPVALVSVAYGHCGETYYNNGHRLIYEGKPIERPGVIPLPTAPAFVALPKNSDTSVDSPFSPTMDLKRSECGWLSTHLCHVDPATDAVACPNADEPHTVIAK
jgi:hypothetical protein